MTFTYKNILYRCISKEELFALILKGIIFPINKKYISLSTNENILHGTEFANKADFYILFNKDILINQGALEIEYSEAFFRNNPHVSKHVVGLENIDDLKQQLTGDETIDEYVDLYSSENEYIIKKIKLEPNLIIDILDKEHKSVKNKYIIAK